MKSPFLQRLGLNRRFGINVSVAAGGTLAAQVIYILSSPIITRLYTPDDFGILAAFTALTTSACVFATLRYELAILLPKQDEEAVNLVFLTVWISLFASLIIGLTAIFFRGKIAAFFEKTELSFWMILFPVAIFSLCLQQVFRIWWNRQNRFHISSISMVIQAVFDSTVKVIVVVIFHAGSIGLLAGYLLGIIASDIFLLSRVRLFEKSDALMLISFKKISVLASKYRTFPLYNSWAELISTLALNLPAVLFAILFSPQVAGFYTLSNRILKIPTRILGLSISQTLLVEISLRRNNSRRIFPLISKVFFMMSVFVALPFAVLMLISKNFFGIIFGPQWGVSGQYAAVMIPWTAMQLVSISVSSVFPILEKNSNYAVMQILLFLSAICPILGSYYLEFDAIRTVKVLSLTNFAVNAIFGITALIMAYRSDAADRGKILAEYQNDSGTKRSMTPLLASGRSEKAKIVPEGKIS